MFERDARTFWRRASPVVAAAGAPISSPLAWLDRRVVAWASYDIASSAYFGVVPPILFPIFFLSVVTNGEARLLSWGATVSAALVIAGFLSPGLGKLADRNNTRWRFLLVGTLVCCMAIAGLHLIGPGQVFLALTMFTVAQTAYLLSQPLYESYLPSIASRQETGRVSTFAWGIGFVGGAVAILAILPLAGGGTGPDNLALYRMSFLVVAAIFLVFSLPALWALRSFVEPAIANRPRGTSESLPQTLRGWRNHREFFKLILAFYLVNDALVTIAVFVADFLRSNFGASVQELLILLLIYTLISAPATIGFGFLADRWSHRKAIAFSLSIWVAAVLLMAFGSGSWVPAVVMMLFGVVFGSTLALFRSLLAQMMPPGREAEFFGFNVAASRISAAAGPLLYGAVATMTGSSRLALLSVLVFILAGATVLATVRVQPGHLRSAPAAVVS